MVEIGMKWGKAMNVACPEYIKCTSHKRHYYMVECKEAYEILKKIKEVKK